MFFSFFPFVLRKIFFSLFTHHITKRVFLQAEQCSIQTKVYNYIITLLQKAYQFDTCTQVLLTEPPQEYVSILLKASVLSYQFASSQALLKHLLRLLLLLLRLLLLRFFFFFSGSSSSSSSSQVLLLIFFSIFFFFFILIIFHLHLHFTYLCDLISLYLHSCTKKCLN